MEDTTHYTFYKLHETYKNNSFLKIKRNGKKNINTMRDMLVKSGWTFGQEVNNCCRLAAIRSQWAG